MPTSFDRGNFRDVIDLTAESIRTKYPKHFYKMEKSKAALQTVSLAIGSSSIVRNHS